jgi:hypothetical protein
MKTGKLIKPLLLMLVMAVVFIGGVVVGNVYNATDFLCPVKASPYILEQDFMSKEGILIPEGTVIDMRKCAYMQRFDYRFALDNDIKLKKYAGTSNDKRGYAELFRINEQAE